MFLLIRWRVTVQLGGILYLHSTMFLLIRWANLGHRSTCKGIYIPLCFYLYKLGLLKKLLVILIYIPLCFYLYWRSRDQRWKVKWFTFHYVSTYTSRTLSDPPSLLHLHSTMFLLILFLDSLICATSSFTFHYVSTYTNSRTSWNYIKTKFTFHYVSTYTSYATHVQ